MRIENQVVSLDLAKRLKELGFKQGSLFYWCERVIFDGDEPCAGGWQLVQGINIPNTESDIQQTISAYTVAELGEMLPYLNDNEEYYTFRDSENNWVSWESENGLFNNGKYIEADTEADARAKMLIYLNENNLI